MTLPFLDVRLAGWWLPVSMLSVLLVLELLLLSFEDGYPSGVTGETGRAETLTAQPADLGLPPLVQYAAISERPLFSASRRPARRAQKPLQPQQPAKPPQLKKYSLSAIIITGEQRLAMIQDNRTRSMLRLREGDELDSWRVQKISKDTVSLGFAGEVQKMILRRLPGQAAPRAPRQTARGQNKTTASAAAQTAPRQRPRRNLDSPVKAGVESGPEPVELRRPDRPRRQLQ